MASAPTKKAPRTSWEQALAQRGNDVRRGKLRGAGSVLGNALHELITNLQDVRLLGAYARQGANTCGLSAGLSAPQAMRISSMRGMAASQPLHKTGFLATEQHQWSAPEQLRCGSVHVEVLRGHCFRIAQLTTCCEQGCKQ